MTVTDNMRQRAADAILSAIPDNGYPPNDAHRDLIEHMAAEPDDGHKRTSVSRMCLMIESGIPSVGAYIDYFQPHGKKIHPNGTMIGADIVSRWEQRLEHNLESYEDLPVSCYEATESDIEEIHSLYTEAFEWLGPQSMDDLDDLFNWATGVENAYSEAARAAGMEYTGSITTALDSRSFGQTDGVVQFGSGARYPCIWNGPRWKSEGLFDLDDLYTWASGLESDIASSKNPDRTKTLFDPPEGTIGWYINNKVLSRKIAFNTEAETIIAVNNANWLRS